MQIETEINHRNDIFQKNQECYDYEKDIRETYINWDNINVFYSPTLNTCILSYYDYKPSEDGLRYYTVYTIKNLFNSSVIFSENNFLEWEKKVEELKQID